MKELILDKSKDDLVTIFSQWNEKKFRAQQVYEWIFSSRIDDFDQMTNIPKELREKLKNHFILRSFVLEEQKDIGDTIKFLWRLSDGQLLESVLMPSENRVTLCISSQIGCAVDCKFCATGAMGFKRQLTVGEILEQVIQIDNRIERRISNIVFMGMGEPFLNYENVIKASHILHDEIAFGIAAKKITLSTSGIVPRIYDFANEQHPFRLAVSLNHVFQHERELVMPISKKYSIEELMQACRFYTALSGDEITFEYVMIKNNNISPKHAAEFRKLIQNLPCKINLIPCNSLDTNYPRPDDDEIELFKHLLEKSTKQVLLRRTRGRNIEAACGMLHNTYKNKENEFVATE